MPKTPLSEQAATVQALRASAYFYVKAWQKNPNLYYDLPNGIFKLWLSDENYWKDNRKSFDTHEVSSDGLKGTDFRGQPSTILKEANGFPKPILWGRREAEVKLGLRGPTGVFGKIPRTFPPHAEQLLNNWKAKL